MVHVLDEFGLSESDHACLVGVARGDKRSLAAAIERFHPVVLALLAHRRRDFAAASRVTDEVVRELFRSLLAGNLPPADFVSGLDRRVTAAADMIAAADAANVEPLHTLHAVPKLVRRRSAAQAIRDLPLGPFTALVLHYHAGWPPAAMVGIVARTETEVTEMLTAAHTAVVQALQATD